MNIWMNGYFQFSESSIQVTMGFYDAFIVDTAMYGKMDGVTNG